MISYDKSGSLAGAYRKAEKMVTIEAYRFSTRRIFCDRGFGAIRRLSVCDPVPGYVASVLFPKKNRVDTNTGVKRSLGERLENCPGLSGGGTAMNRATAGSLRESKGGSSCGHRPMSLLSRQRVGVVPRKGYVLVANDTKEHTIR
jgi:hypothetical protein